MNVLKCYAIYNSRIEYCQGIHLIVGMFYLLYENEPLTFSMFVSLIKHISEMLLMKVYSYELNKLIAVYLPNLQQHMYEQGINAVYFSAGWLLTSLTYVMQYIKEKAIPKLLLAIFDKYLCVSFGVRSSVDQVLYYRHLCLFYHTLRKSFYLTEYLNELPRTDFFTREETIKKYHKTINKYKVNKELLNWFNKETKTLRKMSELRITT